MSSSDCCFLACIQISQEAGQVVWYSHLFQNFPQLVVIHTVKGFGIVNKAEVDIFVELSCFFDDLSNVGNLISGSSTFLKSSLNTWKFTIHILLKPGLENFEHYFTSVPPVQCHEPPSTVLQALCVSDLIPWIYCYFHCIIVSDLPGEISITSDMQMTPALWQKVKRN